MAEMGNIIKMIMTVAMAALIIGVVLMPIMNAVNTEPTFADNEDESYTSKMEKLGTDTKITLELKTYTDSTNYTVEVTKGTGTPTTIQMTSGTTSYIYLTDTSIINIRSGGIYETHTISGTATHGHYTVVGDKFEYENGTLTISRANNTADIEIPYTYIVLPAADGNYIYAGTSAAYNISKNAEGWFIYHSSSVDGYGYGTANDIKTALINGTSNTYVWTADHTDETYYYAVSGVTVKVNDNEPTAIRSIVPLEYINGEKNSDDLAHTLLQFLPIVLLAAIIMAAAFVIVRR